MSLTGHSWLRDRYKRLHKLLLGLILALSLVGSALAFASEDVTQSVFGADFPTRAVGGVLTLTIFLVALIDLVLDWRRRSWEHAVAAERFSKLKQQFRAAPVGDSDFVDEGEPLRAAFRDVTTRPPQIPEKFFPLVKTKHWRKVETSKFMDTHPGGSLTVARIRVWWRGTLGEGPVEEDTPDEAANDDRDD